VDALGDADYARRMVAPTQGGIDCDVHPAVPGTAALMPYLDEYWQEQVRVRGIDGLDSISYPPRIAANGRPDWRAGSPKPGGNLDLMRKHALGAFGSRAAICNPVWGVQALHNEHFAAALARALNDWIAAEWLDREPHLAASITIAAQHSESAVEEIERRAADRRFVQVLLLAMGDAPLGKRTYWPIYESAVRHDLPVGIHAGGVARHAPTGNGWPSYYLEDYTVQAHAFQAHLLSLVHEGVFAKFPTLTVVLIEAGFTWLPQFLWRANKTWRAMRAEVPWVDRPPAEIIRERVRFTLQPTDAPPDPAALSRVLDQIGCEQMLLYSTDYPHWHFDGTDPFPPGFPPALMRRVLIDNPVATYPRLKETLQ
jgi:predicted TIM-barrel fold metal-dependent hydrolase